MSGPFGKKVEPAELPPVANDSELDISQLRGFKPVQVDPEREQRAIALGEARGFLPRGNGDVEAVGSTGRLRVKKPKRELFIKGPKDTLDWFVNLSNSRGDTSYWQTLEYLRDVLEDRGRPR